MFKLPILHHAQLRLSRADRETIHSRENSTEDVIDSERTQNISIYVGLVAGGIILSLTRALLFFQILINASQHLHNRMFAALLRAPIYFFDSNPVGKAFFLWYMWGRFLNTFIYAYDV